MAEISSARSADTLIHPAGQRSTPRADPWRGRSASAVSRHLSSSLCLDDGGGKGWLWSPRGGETQDVRSFSTDSYRRPSAPGDLFDPSRDQASLRSPRGMRRSAEAQRTLTPSNRPKRSETERSSLRRPRLSTDPWRGDKPVGEDASLSPRPKPREEELSPLSSVNRARACSIKGHHYKNRSLASSGLWRDMPTFTPWGCLESLHQPSLSCATARVARGTRSVTPARQPTSPYAEVSSRDPDMSPRTPRPESARANYQAAMSGKNPIAGSAPGWSDVEDERQCPRPSPTARYSPSPSSGDVSSRLHRSDLTRQLAESSPWHAEAAAVAKSPRCPTESMQSVDNGLPAGMSTKHGAVAAALDRVALEAAGCAVPLEKLKVATRLSDNVLHKIEGAIGTPRHFAPPSRSRSNTCKVEKPKMVWRPKVTNGTGQNLELAGVRRARAACARSLGGFNGRPRPQPRWQF